MNKPEKLHLNLEEHGEMPAKILLARMIDKIDEIIDYLPEK